MNYEEMSKLAEELVNNAALVESLLSKVGNQTHDAKNGDASCDLKLFPISQSSNFALKNPQFQQLKSPQLPSRRSTRYGLAPFSHVKQDPSGIYNSPDLHYVDTCTSVCNTRQNVCHDTSHNCYGTEDMCSNPQQIVNTDLNDIEQVASPYMLPNDPSFTPSINSRAGWKFDECYDVQREVGTALYFCLLNIALFMA